jgi:hypothetical protein
MVAKLAPPVIPILADGKPAPDAATLDATAITTTWTRDFIAALLATNEKLLGQCFIEDSYLRDMLILSRDYRTIQGQQKITKVYVRFALWIRSQYDLIASPLYIVYWTGSSQPSRQTSNLHLDA